MEEERKRERLTKGEEGEREREAYTESVSELDHEFVWRLSNCF